VQQVLAQLPEKWGQITIQEIHPPGAQGGTDEIVL
jgi:hypothetical protein